jgi:hypothetical protein
MAIGQGVLGELAELLGVAGDPVPTQTIGEPPPWPQL